MIKLSLKIETALVSYKIYMPFIDGGAVFIPTKKVASMGEEISISLDFITSNKQYDFIGKVVWIVKESDGFDLQQGIGVSLLGDQGNAANLFLEEQILAIPNLTETMTI